MLTRGGIRRMAKTKRKIFNDNVAELLTGNRDLFWLEPTTNAHFK